MIRASSLFCLPVAFALGLTSCDKATSPAGGPGQEQGPGPSSLTPEKRAAFEQEAITIKARFPEGAEFETAMGELLVRYGFPVPAASASGVTHLPAPEDGSARTAPGVAAKAAAVAMYKRVKTLDVTYPFALYAEADIPSEATLDAVTEQVSETVDPYLVAFYHTNGKDDYDKVTIVGLNDDGAGGRNSKIQWKNTTGSARRVTLIVFAFSSATKGVARLKFTPYVGAPTSTRTGKVHTTRVRTNLDINTDNCTGPIRSRIGLKNLTPYVYGTGILAVDVAGKRGGNVRELQLTLEMGFPVTTSGGDFVLPYLQDNVGNVYVDNHYLAWQDDLYSCNIILP